MNAQFKSHLCLLLFIFFAATLLFLPLNSFASHPLITDDAGTLGKGSIEIELTGEYAKNKEDEETEKTTELAASFGYGLFDSLDLVVGVPYLFNNSEAEDETTKEKGISDTELEAKWKFFEISHFSFAIKPGISFPTGDYKKGLGTGKIGYSGFFINSIEVEPFAFHFNAGYIRNENKLEEEKNLWHFSAACEYAVIKDLTIVANVGIEKNADPDNTDNPAFLLGGLVYSINENISLDAGFKYGLNNSEDDYTILAGITIHL